MGTLIMKALLLLTVLSAACSVARAALCVNPNVVASNWTYTCQATAGGACQSAPTYQTPATFPATVTAGCNCKDGYSTIGLVKDGGQCKTADAAFWNAKGEAYKGMDGDGCTSAADCQTGLSCTSKKCVGKKNGQTCTSSAQCTFLDKCDAGKCVTASAIGEACTQKSDCGHDPMTLCETVAGTKQCVKRFSQENGVAVSSSEVCKSVETYGGKC